MSNTRFVLVRTVTTVLLCTTFLPSAHAVFNINVIFATSATPSQRAAFASAEATWESLIADYITPTARFNIPTLDITAGIVPIDGAGGPNGNILGSAGPTFTINDGRYVLPTDGEMEFDTFDVAQLEANGTFDDVILHEMAHVMGFGTLWTQNGVYDSTNFRYTGANALNQYRTEFFQAGATFIPIEQSGGPGTAGGHWAEITPNTSTVRNAQNRPLTEELMTGFLDANPYISRMTVEQFRDIGYLPAFVVIPEPGTVGLLALGVGLLGAVSVHRVRPK